ncbi:MAG: hypothetical protein ILP10_00965 [Lachnospiraceae bacterium]|nr:hypothetical protein [Lachnospiraceae bacterium]
MKKRVLAVIAAAILATCLSACSSDAPYGNVTLPDGMASSGTFEESMLTENYWGYEEYDMYYEFTADHKWYFRNKETGEAESQGEYAFDGSKISIGASGVPDAVVLQVVDEKTIRDPDGDYLVVYVPGK